MSSSSARALIAFALVAAISRAQDTSAPAAPATMPPQGQGTAQQQTAVQQTTPPPAPEAPPLTLEECIALAMKKNFDLRIQGYNVETARENLVISKSSFLPTFEASTGRTLQNSAEVVQLDDGTFRAVESNAGTTSYSAGVTQRIPQTNGTISVNGGVNHTAARNDPYRGTMGVTLNQNLLANAGRTVATAAVERSKIGLGIAYVNYRSRVLTVIRDTESAYYNLVTARENLRIRNNSLELARKLLEENQLRRTTGVATDLEVSSAEVGVANAQRAVLQADQSVQSAEDALLSLINAGNLDARPGPVAFSDYNGGAPSFALSYKAARENYPSTLTAEETIKQLEIDVATARRNRLPTLSLRASLSYSHNDDTYVDALGRIRDNPGHTQNLGLTYTMPWGMRADRARYRNAVNSLNVQKLQLEQLELQLLVSVRNAVRSVETNLASVDIAAKATQHAARQYDLQKARFDNGLATSRQVLQAQDDLESARVQELSAKATLWNAVAELRRLEGSSIQRFGVQLPQ